MPLFPVTRPRLWKPVEVLRRTLGGLSIVVIAATTVFGYRRYSFGEICLGGAYGGPGECERTYYPTVQGAIVGAAVGALVVILIWAVYLSGRAMRRKVQESSTYGQ
jgi:hypothetical protein